MNILSVQSWVCYGHVGNASALFPLQRLGAEVWAVNTVQFSNHTGYGSWTGDVFGGAQVARLIEGIEARGALARCDAVLSGYMGDQGIGHAILDAVKRAKDASPNCVYCCDPVIGDDDTDVYVRAGIPELIRDQALPAADFATPNVFELRMLTGMPTSTLDEVKRAVAKLHQLGPRAILVTSVETAETPADCMDMLCSEGSPWPESGVIAGRSQKQPHRPAQIEGAVRAEALLKPVFADGVRLAPGEPVERVRRRALDAVAALPEEFKRLRNPEIYRVLLSEELGGMKDRMMTNPELA